MTHTFQNEYFPYQKQKCALTLSLFALKNSFRKKGFVKFERKQTTGDELPTVLRESVLMSNYFEMTEQREVIERSSKLLSITLKSGKTIILLDVQVRRRCVCAFSAFM
ncbi:hypothetical protein NPIL_65691 [Nephila pilipes]|uniref:Uncharacterized protein n=1 Tax=Nephila pilipes TaxID=299642 RepID=A0A8X6PUH7_NEPPI|nr:hypothetical protein NPIL_65691 [Nephila pilipes]